MPVRAITASDASCNGKRCPFASHRSRATAAPECKDCMIVSSSSSSSFPMELARDEAEAECAVLVAPPALDGPRLLRSPSEIVTSYALSHAPEGLELMSKMRQCERKAATCEKKFRSDLSRERRPTTPR
eukprot:scaffold231091_cov30-Tisochrysis_lutea.AAC.4